MSGPAVFAGGAAKRGLTYAAAQITDVPGQHSPSRMVLRGDRGEYLASGPNPRSRAARCCLESEGKATAFPARGTTYPQLICGNLPTAAASALAEHHYGDVCAFCFDGSGRYGTASLSDWLLPTRWFLHPRGRHVALLYVSHWDNAADRRAMIANFESSNRRYASPDRAWARR